MDTLTIDTDTIDLPQYGAPGIPAWAGIDWSLYRRSAIVADRKVNYVDLGNPAAKPVLFIHGLSGCWQNWLENLLPFAENHRVLALDLPGFGQSDMPRDGISIPGYARCVNEFLGQLGITRIALVGNSMGGHVSLQLAIEFPELVESVVAVSPSGISTSRAPRKPARGAANVGAALAGNLYGNRIAVSRRPGLRKLFLKAVAAQPEKLRPELTYELLGGVGKPGFVPALDAILTYDFYPRLGEIKAPTLFIWGKNDFVVTSRDARRFAEAIPGARKILVRNTGHMTMLERPVWFNQIASDFVGGSA
ncbi:MAG: alpha/beta hydrolase [Thermoleophilaceae bacterium]|nr:alpha/beta hydrolase [Thermoleophilaceae bacterium]